MALRSVGTRFDDRFRVLGVLGQGAMGAVYDVQDEKLVGVRWALKELDLGVVLEKEKDEAIALFQREAAIIGQLSHPGCPRLVHQFTTDRGGPAFVMTRVDGVPLDQLLFQINRPLSALETLPILLQVCHILEHLHSQDPPIIFRDLKPSNLMLSEYGAVTLIDFGIARRYDPKKSKDTQELGTPGFCSPEQYGRGQTTVRSDLYALGSTAYFLLTRAELQNFAFKVPPLEDQNPKPEVKQLSDLLGELMRLLPKERPESVRVVRPRLEKIFSALRGTRERSTNILRPELRALAHHPFQPDTRMEVFTLSFFLDWLKEQY